jgi:hypothetical protein
MLEVFLKPLNPKMIKNLIKRIDDGEFDWIFRNIFLTS